jgi:hypothetical protein
MVFGPRVASASRRFVLAVAVCVAGASGCGAEGAGVDGGPAASGPASSDAASSPPQGAGSGGAIPPAPTVAPEPPLSNEELAKFVADRDRSPTRPIVETALLALAQCSFDQFGIDYKCAALKDYNEVSRRKTEDVRLFGTVGLAHLRHPAPAVRFQASYEGSIAAFAFDSDPTAAAVYLEALRGETDSLVLANMLKHGVTGARKSASLRTFLLGSIDHSSSQVREVSARLLGDSEVLPQVPEAFEKLLERAQRDPDGHVRATACSSLGATQDDRAMPIFKAVLEDPSAPDEVRNGCFEGVVQSWVGFPYPKRPRRDAYEYTLELLSKKPRGPKTPWRGVARLGWAKSEVKPIDREGAAWVSNVRGFFDAKQLVDVLEDLVLDADAHVTARSEAIYVLRRLNQQELLKALTRGLEKQRGTDAKTLAARAKSLSQQEKD